MEEQNLGFVAGIDHSGFDKDAKHIQDSVEQVAKKVEQSGLSVDEFAKRMQGLLASFDRLTQAVDKNTSAQEKAMGAGKKAADAEKQGADKATDAIDKTGKATDELGRKLKKTGDDGAEGFGKLQKAAAGFFTIAAAKEFGQKIFEVRSEIQSLQTSFDVLVGNKQQAEELFNSIKDFATHTPMQMKDLASAAQTMMSFNIPVEQIMDNLKALGDVSMGDAQKFQSLSLAFSQMSATGKLMGQDLLQMINAGFNPLATISEKTGKSISELKDEMSKGAISADMVRQAFMDATSEGGKFAGMLEKQSQTLGGAYSNLEGAINDMFNAIGEQTEGIMAGAINAATVLVQNYEMVGRVIMQLVSTYGTYKAAVMAVTAAEKIQALSRLAHIKHTTLLQLATDILTKKTALLNATMLANPYVLAATAIGALVSAMVIGIRHTDMLAEGQKRLNDAYAEAEGAAAKEQRQIDDLFGTLKKAKEGTDEWKSAKEAILSQYGGYLKRLGSEVSSLKDVEGAYRAVSRAARDAAMARGMEAAMGNINKDYGDTYSKNFDKIRESLKSRYGEDYASKQMNLLRIHMQRNGGLISDKNKETLKGIMRGTSDFGNMDAWVTAMNNAEKNRQQLVKEAQEKFGKLNAQLFDAVENPKETDKKTVRNKKAIEEEKKNTQAELDALSAKEAAGKKGAELRKKIAAYDKELEAYSTKSDSKASAASAKAAKEEEKQAKEAADRAARQVQLDRELAEKEIEARRAAENALAEAAIAGIEDESERERAQEELEHKKRLADIERKGEELKKARYEANKKQWELNNKDKHYETDSEEGRKGWQGVSLSGNELVSLNAELAKENAEYERAARVRSEALIAAHQSYTDRKIALDKQYATEVEKIDKEIAAANARGDEETVKALERTKRQAATDHAKDQSALSLDILKESPEYIRAFEDLQSTSEATLEYLIEEFEKAKEAAARSLDPKDLKEYTDTIQRMKDEINARNPFKTMAESIKKLDEAQKDTKAAEKRLKQVQKGEKVVKSYRKEGEKMVTVYYTQEEAEKELRDAQDNELKVQKEVTDKKKEAQEVIAKLGDAISALGNQMGGTAGEILNLIGSIMSTTVTAIQAVEGMTAAGVTAMKAIESASVILAVIGAALQIFTALFSLLGNGDNYAEAKAQYDALVEVWDELIDKKKEYLSQSWGKEIEGAKNEALQMLQTMRAETKIIAREVLGSGASWGSSSIGVRMWSGSYKYDGKNWQDVAKEIERRLSEEGLGNVNFTGMESLIEMSSEQLAWIKENYTGFWAMMDTDFKDYLDKLMDYSKQEEEILNQAKEQVTGTSLDTVFDDLMDSLFELADGSEDVMEDIAKNWQQMINKMFVQNLIGDRLRNQLKEWYDDLYQLQSNYTNGIIQENSYMIDLEDLKKRYQSIVDTSKQQIEYFTEMGIIQPIEEAGDEVEEAASKFGDSVKDAFGELLEDPTQDIETWGRNLRNSLIREFIQSRLMGEEFEKWAKEWSERFSNLWTSYENGEIGEAALRESMAALDDEFSATTDRMQKKAESLMSVMGFKPEGDTSSPTGAFDGLRDTFVETLTDMQGDAEGFRKKLEQTLVRDLIEKQVLDVPLTVNGMDFDTFGAYVTDWNRRYAEAVKSGNQEAVDLLMGELMTVREQTMEAASSLRDRLKEATEDTTFKGMASSFITALMDTNKSAEDWAQDIGKTMAQKIIEQMVSASMIQPLLNNLQAAFDTAMSAENATYGSVISDAGVQAALAGIRQSFPELQTLTRSIMESLGVTMQQEAKEGFSDLRGSFVSALMNVEDDAQSFGVSIGKTMMEQMLKTIVDKKYKEQMKSLNDEWALALESGDPSKVESVRQKVQQLYATIADDSAIKKLADDIKALTDSSTSPFDNLRSSFLSALTDMTTSTKDFTKEISTMIAKSFVDSFVLGEQFDAKLAEWKKKYKDITTNAGLSEEQRMRELRGLSNLISQERDNMQAEVTDIYKMLGIKDGQDQSATMNMAEAATYDQFELYLGMETSHLMVAEETKGLVAQVLSTLQGMSSLTNPSQNYGEQIFMRLGTTNEYLLAVKKAVEGIHSEFGMKIDRMNAQLAKWG